MDLNTVSEVLPARVGLWQPGDAWVAGGTVLFSAPQPHLRRLLDLTAFDWPALTVTDAGLEISATCTVAQLAAFREFPAFHRIALRCCHAFVASFKIWNMATVGGNLCAGLPAGPMIALLAALDGRCRILAPSGGERFLSVFDFVVGDGRTALRPGEVLRSILVPASALEARTAFRQGSLTPLGRSAVLVIGRSGDGGESATGHGGDRPAIGRGGEGDPVITVTGSTDRPYRAGEIPESAWLDDMYGSAPWRAHLTDLYVAEVRAELAQGSGV